jgi:hypothetical protein
VGQRQVARAEEGASGSRSMAPRFRKEGEPPPEYGESLCDLISYGLSVVGRKEPPLQDIDDYFLCNVCAIFE